MSLPEYPKVKFVKANEDAPWGEKFGTETKVLPKGWTKDEGRKPFPIDVIWEKDVPIKMRDGVTLYADVFRSKETEHTPQPALLPWSPYGKTGAGKQTLDLFPWRVGVPRAQTSGMEKWEAPDPAEWCGRGYVVVNVDARGAYNSEGDIHVFGSQEGRDGHDSIEWIGTQKWCNGSVALVGNSWLGTTQWFIAAENPPHLKCIAPWEGLGNYYRESICRGGIPDYAFWETLFPWSGGKNQREDVSGMVDQYPLWNAYWEDKNPKLVNINVPMYATASYSTGLHTEGSLRGFLFSSSKEKWLRWNVTQEWHDIYDPDALNDLQKFLDHYMISAANGWEKTPKWRLALQGYNLPSVENRPVTSYPPPEFKYETLFLDADKGVLSKSAVETVQTTSYDGQARGGSFSRFVYKFDQYTELCGFSKAKLFMSTSEHDDMNVYVLIRKLDAAGNPLEHFNIPFKDLPAGTTEEDIPKENVYRYVGPNGRLRASHRAVLPEPGLSEEQRKLLGEAYVWHPHDKEEKLKKDEIVELDIHLWPGGIIFEKGESISFEVSGFLQVRPEFLPLLETLKNYNVGSHTIHTGGKFASSLMVSLSHAEK